MHASPTPRSRAGGFTLIELMIAMVIVAVLATIALPAYFDMVRKSRRSDAIQLMSQVAQAQERWRANNATFANDFGTTILNVLSTAASGVTALNQPYYTISIPSNSGTAYTVRAVAAGSQVKDTRCAAMEMRVAGGNVLYVSSTSAGTIGAATNDPNRCWSR